VAGNSIRRMSQSDLLHPAAKTQRDTLSANHPLTPIVGEVTIHAYGMAVRSRRRNRQETVVEERTVR